MKSLILLVLASLAMAQMPLDLGSDVDIINPYNTDFTGNKQLRGIYGSNPYAIPYRQVPYGMNSQVPYGINSQVPYGINSQVPYGMNSLPSIPPFGLPSYGPYVRYGNTMVPYTSIVPPYYYGNHGIFNQYSPVGPFTPFGTINDRFPLSTPFMNPIMATDSQMPFTSSDIFNSPISTPYGNDLNSFSPYSNGIIEGSSVGYTPYSQAAMFNLITRGGLGKLDLYSKLIVGRTTGLSRKLREVCPEIDGGLSYVSCLTDAHSKTFRCLKGIEDHPRYLTCTHKPIIKKTMRDWYVHDYNWHKEVVKCLSTTTYGDKVVEKIVGVPQVPNEAELDLDDSSSSDELSPIGGKSTWNVEFGASTRQCFFKLRKETSKCQEAASQCPKFKKCYIHPIIKTLEIRKHVKQAKFVKLLDSCLAGTPIPETIMPEDTMVPESMIPEMLF